MSHFLSSKCKTFCFFFSAKLHVIYDSNPMHNPAVSINSDARCAICKARIRLFCNSWNMARNQSAGTDTRQNSICIPHLTEPTTS